MSPTPSPNVKSMSETQKFHPALFIANVKSLIPITLDLESWIYTKISSNILTSILIDNDWDEHAWKNVADFLQDNRNSKAVYLNKEFTNTNHANFSTTNAYPNRLKSLVDQLANVGAPISDHKQEDFTTFAMARPKLALEETTHLERAKQDSSSTALVANNYSLDVSSSFKAPRQSNNSNGRAKINKNRNNTKNRNKNNGNGGNNQASGGRNNNRWGSQTVGGGHQWNQQQDSTSLVGVNARSLGHASMSLPNSTMGSST
ncbi:uncharacterized protein LOC131648913 [Vicia villosa]|uniref:uncharacterized protein LOC131648913 n=1 Tax=Vicia villosa TaxID=3911 RepID=UPI00273B0761|nr:uncharacterized protein LOC131648913 [Vicia villosa]